MNRIQFFSPHPDDIECFAGGALLRHHFEHDTIQIVMMTRGGRGSWIPGRSRTSLEALRTREAEARLAELPSIRLHWYDLRDGGVATAPLARPQVEESLDAFAPDLVYLPERSRAWSANWHRDHLATGAIVAEAARAHHPGLRLRHYHSLRPDAFVDVSPFYIASQRALRFYRSQSALTARPPFLLHGVALMRYLLLARWARRVGRDCRYAEAFREESAPVGPSQPSGAVGA